MVSLAEARSARYYGQRILVEAMAIGKMDETYLVPRGLDITCPALGACKECPLKDTHEDHVELEPWDPEVLEMMECTKDQQLGAIRRLLQSPSHCNRLKAKPTSMHSFEVVRLAPMVETTQDHAYSEYLIQHALIYGTGFRTNCAYRLECIPLPTPRTQAVILLVLAATPLETSLDTFTITRALRESLTLFQPEGSTVEAITTHLARRYEDWTYNVAQCYGREDLLMVMDLTYHSLIGFAFGAKLLERSWVECLVLGDTQCGKTDTARNLLRHFGAGERISGENATFTGLVGGFDKGAGRLLLQWGKLPLNDRRLLMVDELSGFDLAEFERLSDVRSSGRAKITRVQQHETSARCRILWISNPRDGRALDTYSFGVEAIKSLCGKVEDIARFDLFLNISNKEFDFDSMAVHRAKRVPHVFTADLSHALVMWAWSRRPDQVQFTEEAEEAVMNFNIVLRHLYDTSIPLVVPSQYVRLARLSAACAAMLYSTLDGETVLIRAEHVEVVSNFLEKCFQKSSMNYDLFSYNTRTKETHTTLHHTDILWTFRTFTKWPHLVSVMLSATIFRQSTIRTLMGYEESENNKLFAWLNENGLIFPLRSGAYAKSPMFNLLLKELLKTDADQAHRLHTEAS